MAVVDPQVLVVGSGPAGLVIALTLAQNGISIRLIEKLSSFHHSLRGAAIQARSLELFNFLGVYDEMVAGSIPLLPVRSYKFPGGRDIESVIPLAPLVDATPDIPFPNPRMLGQAGIESILRSHLTKLGVEIECSKELVKFEHDSKGVTAEILKRGSDNQETRETARFDFLIGADGARGVTRKQLGLTFLGEPTSNHVLIGDLFVKGLTPDVFHYWRPSPTDMIILRPSEVEGLFYAVLSTADPSDYPKISASRESLQEFINKITTRDDIIVEGISTLTEFSPNIRVVNKFNEGRVFVVGDAAHVHSPAGGQGMNSSIQDSFNLGWKLSLVCKKLASLSILETYSDERLPIIQAMLSKTTEVHKKLLQSDIKDKAAWDRPKSLDQLRVNCRWSPILVDEQVEDHEEAKAIARDAYGSETDDQLRAGDRAPDASDLVDVKSNEKTSLFSIFKPSHHTALLFNPSASELPGILESLATWPSGTIKSIVVLPKGADLAEDFRKDVLVLEDTDGHAYDSYRQMAHGGFPIIIIRPDGVIGGIVKGPEGVKTYYEKLFAV
ncbi:FAD binding domain-containing protein [Abortiporus biennis]|nr:FAD binding domain-containing protein [Abortiporus biennis]